MIALRSGGVLETVTDGPDGRVLRRRRRPAGAAAVVAAFDPAAVDPADCVAAARRFGVERFQERLRAIVDETVAHGEPAASSGTSSRGPITSRVSRRGAESMRIR